MTALPSDIFARRLRAERERRRLSQAELARQMAESLGANVDPSAVTRIEQQTRAVRLDEAVAMAEVLHTSLSSLLTDDLVGKNEALIAEAMIELVQTQRQWQQLGEKVARLTRTIQTLREEVGPLDQSSDEETRPLLRDLNE